MKLPEDYQQAIRTMSDEQLDDMLAHEADYLPNAIAAAKAELSLRELAVDKQADAEVRAMPLPAWEYRVETVRGTKSLPRQVKRLCDDVGEQGWELVSVNHSWFPRIEAVLYFKRRKQMGLGATMRVAP